MAAHRESATRYSDLFDIVQPTGGWTAIVGIKGARVRQTFANTREDVEDLIHTYLEECRDVYFGVAKYSTDENRTKQNVQALKSLWVDIDCGPSKTELSADGVPKGYIDQSTALKALQGFCRSAGLPKPLLVNSGRGVHAYWPLDTEVTREEWEPLAKALRDKCMSSGLYVDPAVFEAARILRVPGTLNFKDSPPAEVTILLQAKPTPVSEIRRILGVSEAFKPLRSRGLSPLAQSLISNITSLFSKIMRKSAKGKGCQQLLQSYMDRATLSEPRWFDALSIAKFCEDKESAIHKISSGHPDYDPVTTERKLKHIVGPHTCEVFEQNNPGGCTGCPWAGKIKSPISLGKELLSVDEEVEVETEEDDAPTSVTVPKYPEPFFRGKYGGIYYNPPDDEADPVFVYENDLYVVKRMHDIVLGDVTVMKVHMPKDGVKEFVVPNIYITEPRELRKALAAQGVLCGLDNFKYLTMFIMLSVRELQKVKRAEKMRSQFGWAEKDNKFILGDREISKDGVYHSPPSQVTSSVSKFLQPVGSFEKWREVFDLYNQPGLEPHAFAALTAFGAPLLKFFGQNGAIINVIHPRSGTGKTTILHMCNSVYGHPEKLCAMWDDTLNAKIMRLGVMNNLPFTVDEITNMTPADFSTLIYNMSQGRGKDRVKASANEMRANLTSWQTVSLCSSNAAFYEKMASLKHNADGEMMRLMEYYIEPSDIISPAKAKDMFDHQLKTNYGHAGEMYIKHLLNNYDEVVNGVLGVQAKIDSELKLTSRERFWSALAAANISGGILAKQAGVINWDMKRIYKWVTLEIQKMRGEIRTPVSDDAVAILGDYINRHISNILAVDDEVDNRSMMPKMPIMEPRGELLIRYEPDTKKLFLAAGAFRRDCVKYQINYRDTINQLKDKGIFLESVTKRLTKGMKVAAPGVHSLVFTADHSDFIDMGSVIGDAPEQTSVG
jgi:hypothetical protein